jgi:hypothetical protein
MTSRGSRKIVEKTPTPLYIHTKTSLNIVEDITTSKTKFTIDTIRKRFSDNFLIRIIDTKPKIVIDKENIFALSPERLKIQKFQSE